MLEVKHTRIVRLTQDRDRAGECCNHLLIEQNAHSNPVPQAAAGAIQVWIGARHKGLTASALFGSPAGSALRQVPELENVIAAVEAVAAEEVERDRQVPRKA